MSGWNLVKRLGQGGFGVTDKYEHNGKFYTVKRLKNVGKHTQANFEVEASNLRAVNAFCRVGLPCLYLAYFDKTSSQFIIIFDYVEGVSMESNKLKKPVAEDFVWEMFRQVGQVLAKLHDYNIVHRDIKPGNIVYNNALNTFTIIDLGLACIDKCKNVGGTVYFMSPKIRRAYDNNQPKSLTLDDYKYGDIYALALTAFYMLTNIDNITHQDILLESLRMDRQGYQVYGLINTMLTTPTFTAKDLLTYIPGGSVHPKVNLVKTSIAQAPPINIPNRQAKHPRSADVTDSNTTVAPIATVNMSYTNNPVASPSPKLNPYSNYNMSASNLPA